MRDRCPRRAFWVAHVFSWLCIDSPDSFPVSQQVELAMGDEAAMVIKNGKKVGFAHLAIHIDLRSVHTV
jgi:hypothetical protein